MRGIGTKKVIWTKELDNKLLNLISEGKNAISITNEMRIGTDTIRDRIKAMGFEGLIDARRVMMDAGE